MLHFTEADLLRFAAASGDRNPLHLDPDYAHTTPFGERVVYGALATLRGLAVLGKDCPAGLRPTRITARFQGPLHLGRSYDVESRTGAVSFLEHGKRLSSVSVAWAEDAATVEGGPEAQPVGSPASASGRRQVRGTAADRGPGDLRMMVEAGQELLDFRPDLAVLRELAGEGASTVWSDAALASVACASYLAGMEVPGRQALLLDIDIELAAEPPVPSSGGFEVDFSVARYDERFGMVSVSASLHRDAHRVAQVRVRALRRPPAVVTEIAHDGTRRPANHADWAGLRALVVGGSRGLGAHLVAQLALSGARVDFTYQHSSSAAERLVAEIGPTDQPVRAHQGDARDPRFWEQLALDLDGDVDIVICCAWPVFAKLGTAPSATTAAIDHVGAGLAMVSGPVLAMLPRLRKRAGDVVVLSSELVQSPDSAYWHYVTGKLAVEGFAQAVSPSVPEIGFHLVRPSMLATDYAQSAVGLDPMPPEEAARVILESCRGRGGGVHVLEIPREGPS